MKKILSLVMLVIISTTFSSIKVVSADTDSSHKQFVSEYIQNVICQENGNCEVEFKMKKEIVYDIYLKKTGYVYDFENIDNGVKGYLIIKRIKSIDAWEYSVVEFNLEINSPYNNKNSKNIYLGYGMYFEYKKGTITDLLTGSSYDYTNLLENLAVNFELRYPTGGVAYYEDPITYNFLYMIKSETLTDYGYPLMDTAMKYSNHYNNCSPTAGVSIALYWDKYYPDLVPNVYPLKYTSNGYVYKRYSDYYDAYYPYSTEKTNIRNLHSTFYIDMETNTYIPLYTNFGTINTGIGTLPSKFYDVLEEYFEDANLSLQHYDIIESADDNWGFNGESMTSSNWTQYTSQIDLNRPVVIQLGVDWSVDYTLIRHESQIVEGSSSITYTYREYPYMSAHTVVGYGYRTYTFYQYHSYYGYPYVSRIDNFMVVANGWGGTSYVNASDNDIGMAYSIYVD